MWHNYGMLELNKIIIFAILSCFLNNLTLFYIFIQSLCFHTLFIPEVEVKQFAFIVFTYFFYLLYLVVSLGQKSYARPLNHSGSRVNRNQSS